ncbi:MAG TPA: hypothetical protein VFN38_10845 [Gemmatimonadaceae bacterium]|nr:hypothetical protein [Gemmatimonadaceae bacterium]
MTAPRVRPRPPRIAASLCERRNDFRPQAPLAERLLAALGAHPSFADAVLGDLAEERARREKAHGRAAARWWYAREAIRAVPHLLWNALRHGGSSGRAHVAALLAGVALVPALIAALALRDSPPAFLVFEGQRGSDVVNGVVLNSTHPVQLVTRALDAKKRELPPGSVRYRWAAGAPIAVTESGVVTCTEPGDAELRATAGAVATTLIVRCHPVSAVHGELVLSMVAGETGQELPISAYAPDGQRVSLLAFEARVQDSTIAVMNGLHIRPIAPGTTSVTVRIGDAQTLIHVSVYERVRTLVGLRPDQRLVSAPVRLAAGDTIRWPLPTGKFWLRFTPDSGAQPVPRIVVSGGVSCMPAFGPTDQATCLVRAPGARVRIAHPGGSRKLVVGHLALERRDE